MVVTYVRITKRLSERTFLQCVLLILIHLLTFSTCSRNVDGLQNRTSSGYHGHSNADKSTIDSSKSTVIRGHSLMLFVLPPPDLPCGDGISKNCSEDLPLVCVNENCECALGLCWSYEAKTSWASIEYDYYCGECGELGSECNQFTKDCNYPGFCGHDGFCHCKEGEHREDICFVNNKSAVWMIFEGSLIVFVFITIAALIYITIMSYRRHRTLLWCRFRRRRRSRRRRQETHPHSTTEKSPAYTTQQILMQNFHHSDDSSFDELTEDETSNVEEKTINSPSTTKSTDLPPIYDGPSNSRLINFSPQDESTSSINLEQNTGESSHPSTFDTSGMTEYYNTNTTNL